MSIPASETFGQARKGSVAAIIQVLNEQLAGSGIRTRAMVVGGILQLLCEAATEDLLTRDNVVSKVREILESISPQGISKVKINSRLVREEQLLWLEEINRDPENSVLWSETITLKRPFFMKRWMRDRNLKPAAPPIRAISEPEPTGSNLSGKLIGAAGIAALMLATGWIFREDIAQLGQPAPETIDSASSAAPTDLPPLPEGSTVAPAQTTEDTGDRAADTTPPDAPTADPATASTTEPSEASAAATTDDTETSTPPANTGATADAFAEAVRIANQASAEGQTANTAAEWLDLAARWQRASDLMAQIPSSSEQYAAAQERVSSYADNSQAAQAEAESRRSGE